MIDFDIDLLGTDPAARAIDKGLRLERVIGDEINQWAEEVLRDELAGMGNYAPPPPDSTYVRTGNLGDSWEKIRRGVASVAFRNRAGYAVYVVGNAFGSMQARIHAGRWWLMQKRVEGRLDDLMRRVERRVDRELR